MPMNGNSLAKYVVMVSQVVAWCTVSVMLLRRGLNQVNSVAANPSSSSSSSSSSSPAYGRAAVSRDDGGGGGGEDDGRNGTADDYRGDAPPFDDTGTPAMVAGVIMIAIAVIMLIISPTIMLMKMIEKRKRRILDAELESPPKYEDVVESAPRYSSLFVFNNDGEMTLSSGNVKHKEMDDVQKHLV